ncbi:MAG: glycosyltransferase family 9 protein [Syntrophobacteraceae bacterium]|jgi:heptosyltransferase-2
MRIHIDCRYYKGSMPCVFHKKDGRVCENCGDYDEVKTRLLIVKLAAIGDVLRTTSILPALTRKYPGSKITWITRANAAPLLEGNPLIDRVLAVEGNYLEYLKNECFSVGICLDADALSATILSIAQCKERFGFYADESGSVRPADESAIDWWLMGLNDTLKRLNRKTYQQIMYEICGLQLPAARPQLYLDGSCQSVGDAMRESLPARKGAKVVGINTGGGHRWQRKKWTVDAYIECIHLLSSRYPGVGLLLMGGPEEVEQNKLILEAVADKVVDGGCNNSLMQFASLVKSVDVLLTPDSLAMHIGVALEKPTIVLVGPTSPWELDVFGKGAILHSDIDCLACYLSRCDKEVNCMNSLAPEYVVPVIGECL